MVDVSPAGDTGGPWRSAASALAQRFGPEGGELDCRRIAIWPEAHGAVLVFTTRDGRQALRHLQSPAELAPVVGALGVTLQVPPVAAPPADAPPPSKPAAAASRASSDAAIFLQLTAGGRVSGPGGFASPSLAARAGIVLRGWELTALAQWDPVYGVFDGVAPPAFTMSRYAAGVGVGRRVALAGCELAFGLATTVAVIQQSAREDEPTSAGTNSTESSHSSAEPTVGAYAGVIWPPHSAFRARAELTADAVVSRIGRSMALDPSFPDLPWWSSLLSVGVEWEVP